MSSPGAAGPGERRPVVAIDGPAGAGKSTLAAALALRLGVDRLDSGAMYRAVALAALRSGVDPADGEAVRALALGLEIEVAGATVALNGEDVSAAVRTADVSAAASVVAAHGGLREELVRRQREWVAGRNGAVVEGRDIGSVVLPGADLKVFLTADDAERARRRALEMGLAVPGTPPSPGTPPAVPGSPSSSGSPAPVPTERVAAELAERDRRDATREVSPLVIAPGAVVIDTSNRSVEDLVEDVMGHLAAVGAPGVPAPASPAGAAAPSERGPASGRAGLAETELRSPAAARPVAPLRRARVVPPTLAARAFYGFCRVVVVGLSRALWHMTVEGRENVPADGAFILAPVHRNNIDTILMGGVTRRRLCYMAKDTLWKWRPGGWLFSALGGFPVHRHAADREALRTGIEVLENGWPLVVFPEGTRQAGPVLAELYEGVAYLALRTGVPIIPVGIGGSDGAWPKGSALPRRTKVHLVIGSPLRPAAEHLASPVKRVPRAAIGELTEKLRVELQAVFDIARERAQAR